MEEKKRIINLLTIINEEYRKNDKKVFKEFKYKTLGGDDAYDDAMRIRDENM